MATSNNRDVKLGVEIQTAGAESLGKAAAEVRALAKAGGDAAPYLTELADGLDLAIAQAKEFSTFKTAAAEVQTLTVASAEAAVAAERLQASYKGQAAVAETARAAQASIAASLDTTKRAMIGAVEKQTVLKASFKAGEVEAKAYAAQSSNAAASLAGLKAATAGLTLDLKLAKTATSDTEAALAKLAASSLRADESASRLQATLRAQSTAMESAAAAGAALGADFANVANAQARLDQALQGAVTALEQKAAADRAVIDLDNQHALASARLADRVQFLARAHAEETAAAEAAAVAERALATATEASAVAAARAAASEAQRVTSLREQAESDRDAVRSAAGLAEQRAAGALALQAELAAQRDAALSNKQYADGVARAAAEQRAAAADALRFVEALDAEAVAAEKTGRLLAEFHANDAQAQKRAAYEREVAAALNAVDASAAAAAQSMARLQALTGGTATSLQEAFGAVGVRSIAAIQAEINKTADGLGYLQRQFKAGALSAYDLQRATGAAEARMQALRAEMSRLPETTGLLERMGAATLDVATKFGALGVAAATLGFVAKPVLDANLALDSMRRVLTTVYGSAEQAARQIEFLRTVAERSGLSVLAVGDAYTRFAASARASGIETALVQKVFEATANAAGNLGLSSDKTTHILDALGQMANKGTVSMEELRQQLGDSLPGAMSLLAKGLKITEAELVKLVTSGKLLTSEALGPLAEAMTALAAPSGRVEGLRAAMSRLGNQFTLAYQQISDTAFYRGITTVVGGLATNFDAVGTAAKLMFEVLAAGKVINLITNFIGLKAATADAAAATRAAAAEVAAHTGVQAADSVAVRSNAAAKVAGAAAATDLALATRVSTAGTIAHAEALALDTTATRANAAVGAVSAAATAANVATAAGSLGVLARASTAVATAGRGVLALLGGLPGLAIAATLAAIELGPAVGRLAAEFLGFNGPLEKANKLMAEAAEQVARNQKARDAEAGSLVQVKVKYAELSVALGVNTAELEKQAKAKKALGEASVIAAELTGNEYRKLVALTQAHSDDAAALVKVAAAKQAEADATAVLIFQTEKSIKGKGKLGALDQAELARLEDKIGSVGKLTEAESLRLKGLEAAQEDAAKSILATKEQIKLDKEKLQGQRAAAEEADALAKKEALVAEQAKLTAAQFKDNTANLRVYQKAYLEASRVAASFRIELALGNVSLAEASAASVKEDAALGLLKNAILDAGEASATYTQFKQAESAITAAGLQVKLEEHKTLLRSAELHGLDGEATRQKIEIKKIELQIARESAQAKRDEATETIRATGQTIRELDALGALTPEQRVVLQLRILTAQAKRVEALAGLEATKSIAEEIAALLGLTAAKRAANAVPTPTGAPVVNAPAANAGPEPAKLNSGDYVGSDGKTRNSRGEVIGSILGTYDIGATAALQIKERNGTLSASDLALAQTAAAAAEFNAAFVGKSGAFSLNGARDAAAQVLITQRLLEAVQRLATPSSAGGSNTSSRLGTPIPTTGLLTNSGVAFDPNAAAVQAAVANQAAGTTGLTAVEAKQAAASTSHTVTINLPGGRSSTIAVSTALDGTALANLLAQLAQDHARVGG